MGWVCAWCGTAIERGGYDETFDNNISHGMCPACREALASPERSTSLQQYLNTIPIPILLIDDSDAVLTMNLMACDRLRLKLDGTEMQLFGKVFECIHSRSPQGCGRTIHSAGCAIRRSVTTTFNTGEPQVLVPATLRATDLDDISEVGLHITTAKIGGLVLLRIDVALENSDYPEIASII